MKCKWELTYGDMIIPVCPNCGEPLYEKEKCVFCGQEIEWEEEVDEE